jgi:hypothetical protein
MLSLSFPSSLSLIAGVLSCVFAMASGVFTFLNIRGLRKSRAAVDAQQRALKTAVEDFVRRAMSGEVVAITTEGEFGMLVVEPCGPNALRVSVEPFEDVQRH